MRKKIATIATFLILSVSLSGEARANDDAPPPAEKKKGKKEKGLPVEDIRPLPIPTPKVVYGNEIKTPKPKAERSRPAPPPKKKLRGVYWKWWVSTGLLVDSNFVPPQSYKKRVPPKMFNPYFMGGIGFFPKKAGSYFGGRMFIMFASNTEIFNWGEENEKELTYSQLVVGLGIMSVNERTLAKYFTPTGFFTSTVDFLVGFDFGKGLESVYCLGIGTEFELSFFLPKKMRLGAIIRLQVLHAVRYSGALYDPASYQLIFGIKVAQRIN